jgi:Tfp pilus assembly protein PilF
MVRVSDKRALDESVPDERPPVGTPPGQNTPGGNMPGQKTPAGNLPDGQSGGPLTARGQRLLDDEEDRHDEAIAVLRQAVAAREPAAAALLARAYLDRGFHFEAVDLLLPRVKAGRTDLALLLADALAGTGDVDRAEDVYRVAVNGGDVEAMNTFGVFLRHRGRYSESTLMLRRAAEAGHLLAPVNLVEVQWEHLDDPRPAIRTAEYWADESRPSTLLGLAFIRTATRRFDDAEKLYRRAAELGAHRGHIEYALFLQEVRDDLGAAERELEAAERDQETGWALAFGQFLADVGRPAEARAYLLHAAHWGSPEAAAVLEELDGDPQDD